MKWFRFYSEVLQDEKVQTLTVELRWAWVCMLCLANEGEPRGVLPSLKRIAYRMRINEKKAQTIIDTLITERLIDQLPDGGLTPHNWDERQRKSDNVSDRVNKHRNAQKNGKSVTLHVTKPPVTRNGILSARTDLDLDTDTDNDVVVAEQPLPTGDHQTCVSLAMELFGDSVANTIAKDRDRIANQISGEWGCYEAAMRQAHANLKSPKAKRIQNIAAYLTTITQEFVVTGVPSAPVGVDPLTKPSKPKPAEEFYQAPPEVCEELERTAKAKRAQR